jgi:hypothetical protein
MPSSRFYSDGRGFIKSDLLIAASGAICFGAGEAVNNSIVTALGVVSLTAGLTMACVDLFSKPSSSEDANNPSPKPALKENPEFPIRE